MKDLMGKAIRDYYQNTNPEDLLTETSISETDEMPVEYLFRNFSEMNTLEQKALQFSKGKVLDIGCGTGRLYQLLQEFQPFDSAQGRGIDYIGLDQSEGQIVMAKQDFPDNKYIGDLSRIHKEENKQALNILESHSIENLLFGSSNYIASNSFITSHDNVNVFSPSSYKYYVKRGSTAIDIQLI